MIDTTPFRRKLLDLAITGKLVPKQGEWRTVKLGEIADVQLGKMLDRGKNKGRPYQYLANINVRWGGFDLNDLKETLFADEEVGKFALREGDLLMCEGGVPGRCAIWREKNSQIKYQKALHRIRPTGAVLPEYLQLYFEAIHNKADFTRKFTGSTIHHLPREVLVNQSIPLPPIAEQKVIVKRLEELLKLEGEIAAESAALDDLIAAAKRKVLDLAIRGKLVPQDSADEPASELLKRIAEKRETQVSTDRRGRNKGSSVIFRGADRSAYETRDGKTVCIDDEIPFDIPDSWAWARLGTVCDAQLGKMLDKAKNVGAPYKYLANANVRWGSFDYSDIRETLFTPEEVEKFELRKGDVVMCEGGVPGRCAVWQSEVADMKFQKAVHRLRSSVLTPLLIQNFFAYAVSADWFEAKLTGTTIKHLPREALVSILIPIPPLAEQKRIVSKIEEVRGMVGLIMRT